MLRNYLIIAWRVLWNNKFFSIINILGLAVGMAASILIFQYVTFELSYDKFWTNSGNIYRVIYQQWRDGEIVVEDVKHPPAIAPFLFQNIPEIRNALRLNEEGIKRQFSKINDDGSQHAVNFNKFYIVDSSFFQFFNIQFLQGNPATALKKPNSVVLTESSALKLFATKDAIGKNLVQLVHDRSIKVLKIPLIVTGVIKDPPENTHLDIELLLSDSDIDWLDNVWTFWRLAHTYVELFPDSNLETIQSKFDTLVRERYTEYYTSNPELSDDGFRPSIIFQNIHDIHLGVTYINEMKLGGNRVFVIILSTIALFILLIAWINYINLVTSKAITRAGEVGIKKVVGASRFHLILQFICESLLVNIAALFIAITFIHIAHLGLGDFGKLNIEGPAFSMYNSVTGKPDAQLFISILGILFIFNVCIAGIYPAFILSSFNISKVFKGKFSQSKSGVRIRKSLVVLQFALSCSLLASILIIYSQLTYMINSDKGFKDEQVLVIDKPEEIHLSRTRMLTLKSEMLKHPSISNVTTSSSVPGKFMHVYPVLHLTDTGDISKCPVYDIGLFTVDHSFIDFYELDMITGRNFSEEYISDDRAIICNKAAAKLLGFSNPKDIVGQQVKIFFGSLEYSDGDKTPRTCIGVVDDYHHYSLQENIKPIVFVLEGGYFDFPSLRLYFTDDRKHISIKIKPDRSKDYQAGIDHIESTLVRNGPTMDFDYTFLNEEFDHQYNSELKFREVFLIFTIVAIFIACLGLFGLSSFSILQRTKEIGIRKILGAGIFTILKMLMKGYMKLIILSCIISFPIVYYFSKTWLNNFAYRIDISIWYFFIPSLIVLVIAIITIGFQTVRTALANPVDALRYE
ncbi:MAG: ABC transporter permease [Cyclobacteriaceae bacterium]|nr:ABC transporter permease [Cyclobacteriaceae bacterium]